ncbi:CoA-acylating methylmalonate-semialdehyde dehydrogenase [Ferrimicrobium acidiphilum]|uniref:methylmalonate-semialdehyde dehydrogenase (CoA acylating) n=1 Tax=Ferrimicrobium acidiphilum TaxID=121039 RepID=A0ABV3Y0M2_9ACTN|nr:CoA-acylating methylmalonate-semialdehyde dehydrogenase [Actinomycetota bacterium]
MTRELVGHFIDGKEVFEGEQRGPVYNPALGRTIREVLFADAALVDRAVAGAKAAQVAWGEESLARRQRVMFDYRSLLLAHREEIVERISEEHGKVLGDAAGEFARGVEVVEFVTGLPQLLKGQYNDSVSRGVDAMSVRYPLGVAAGITPFNFPAMVPMWMFPVALAVGNGFVLKPSEKDPSTAIRLAELFVEAGGPEGLFNVVNGDQHAVGRLLEHPDVKAVSFVGSTPIARSIYERAAKAGKRVQALGGAKNHMVVLPDADVDTVAESAVSAAYGSAGERCMAISVMVLVGEGGQDYLSAIEARMSQLKVGSYLDPKSEMGPLITGAHRERVAGLVSEAEAKGAQVVVDGRKHPLVTESGFFFGPTLIDDVRVDMDAYREEIFGPVLLVLRAPTLDAAIALVNGNPYANGAAIFTGNGGAARTFIRHIDSGMVGVNVPIPVPVAYHSFGGAKHSLFGDTHVHGEEGIRFYTRAKAVTMRWPGEANPTTGMHFVTNA